MNPRRRKFITPAPAAATLVLSLMFVCGGCETELGGVKPEAGRAPTTQMTLRNEATPSSPVPKHKAWSDAESMSAREAGREPLVGGGLSMNPIYGDNTMIIVKPVDYSLLKAGMTVVYMNSAGRRVAHKLVAREGRAWRSQGINNLQEDRDLVTPENYIGVVYMSLASEGGMVVP